MSPDFALENLRILVAREAITVRNTTFRYEPFGHAAHVSDVKELFLTLIERIGGFSKGAEYMVTAGMNALDLWTNEALFNKLFDLLYIKQKLVPVTKHVDSYLDPSPLPTLFIGREKTQVRQIPLVSERPWPFKFLLELGGMVICKTDNRRDLLLELRQFMANFPQVDLKVHAEEWPDGEILIVTTWFRILDKEER